MSICVLELVFLMLAQVSLWMQARNLFNTAYIGRLLPSFQAVVLIGWDVLHVHLESWFVFEELNSLDSLAQRKCTTFAAGSGVRFLGKGSLVGVKKR